jgi:hypothetical protein
MSMLGAPGFRLHHGVTAATLDDAQMERIIMAADPKAVFFIAKVRTVDGKPVKQIYLRWRRLGDRLVYFEVLHREDAKRRATPSKTRKKRERIVARAKSLASLVADDPGLPHHRDALSQLITDASIRPTENPELDKRDKGSAFDVTIRDHLAPAYHEFFGRNAGYKTNPDTGEVSGPFICFALAVCKELKICKADGKLPNAAAIKAALGYKTRRKKIIS